MSKPISFAILGAGIFAKEAHIPGFVALRDSAAIKAVYSKSEKSAKELATEINAVLGPLSANPAVYHDSDPAHSLDVLLKRQDIDAVIVILPISLQPTFILKALAAGKHVLSEKPVAKDIASAVDLIKTYFRDYYPRKLIWRVAENFETDPGFQAIGQAVKNGKIGKPTHFIFNSENFVSKDDKWYKTPWRTVPDYQGGFLLDGGVHQPAAMRIMLGEPLKYVSAFASLNMDYLAPLDTITTTVQTVSGVHGNFTLTFALPTPAVSSSGYKITGTKGQISTSDVGGKFRVSITDAQGKVESSDYERSGVPIELVSFVAAINGSDDGIGDPINALKDVAFLEGAFNSHGQRVDILASMKEVLGLRPL